MHNKLILVFFIIIGLSAKGQDFWLASSGEIPPELLRTFREGIVEKYNVSIFNQSYNTYKRAKFQEKSDFYIEELLTSGNVTFGDTITNYLTAILHHLQKSAANTEDIDIFLMKDIDANAFMTKGGKLLVTNALVAHSENEAQLAFIIAHEIIHKEKEHIDQEFEYTLKGISNTDDNFTANPKYKLYTFSKNLELEADKYALLEFIKNTNYNIDSIKGVFNMLMRGHLPLHEVKFDSSFFETDNLEFRKGLFLDKVKEISTFEDYNDRQSTHPNVKVRKKQFDEIVADFDSLKHRESFVIGQAAFKYIKQQSCKQLVIDQIREREYGMAIQNALYLKTIYPDNTQYFDLCIAHSLYALTVYKNAYDFNDIKRSTKYVEGELQQIYNFTNTIKDEEFNALVVCKLYYLKKQYPENEIFSTFYNDALSLLINTHKKDLDDYSTVSQNGVETADSLSTKEFNDLTKANKQRYTMAVNEENEHQDFISYVFYNLLKDSTFVNTFKNYAAIRDSNDGGKKVFSYYTVASLIKNSLPEFKPDTLNITNMIIVEPKLYYYDTRKENKLQVDHTFKTRQIFNSSLKKAIGYSTINSNILLYDDLNSSDINKLNDLIFLQNWFSERVEHEDKNIPATNKEKAQEIIEKYNTKYVFYPSYVAVRKENKNPVNAIASILYIVTIPVFPYFVIESFIPQYNNLYYGYLFNLETGQALYIDYRSCKSSGKSDHLSSMIYNTLNQISKHD